MLTPTKLPPACTWSHELRARLKRMAACARSSSRCSSKTTSRLTSWPSSNCTAPTELPELDTITVHRRLYPANGFMAHVIGYVGQVSEEDAQTQPAMGFHPRRTTARTSGVEQYYNEYPTGNGSRQVLVNSRGKEVGTLSDVQAVPGKQLKLDDSLADCGRGGAGRQARRHVGPRTPATAR